MEILNEETHFSANGITFKEFKLRYPNGFEKQKIYLEFSTDSVVIVPITSDNRFLLIRQPRFGQKGYNWEFPSGGMESNESSEDAAHRELLEETGTKAKLTFLGTFHAFTGVSNLKAHAYLANNLEHNLTWQNLEPNEEIIVDFVEKTKVLEMIRMGKITDTYLLSALMMYIAK